MEHRILLFTHAWGDRAETDFVAALARRFEVVLHDVDLEPVADVAVLADRAEAEAVVTFWRFRQMNVANVPWNRYAGTKVLVDHDAFASLTSWAGPNSIPGRRIREQSATMIHGQALIAQYTVV